jgi:hypothetical protein
VIGGYKVAMESPTVDNQTIYNGNSLSKALAAAYPEHKWEVWKFSQVPKGFWKDDNNARNFLDKVSFFAVYCDLLLTVLSIVEVGTVRFGRLALCIFL